MDRFKKGQIIKLRRNVTITYPKGCLLKVGCISGNYVELNTVLPTKTFNIVERNSMDSNQDYQTSNRNKLREHIKSLGFSAIDLSVAAGFNKAYFGSETGESRFNSRGDISDDRLLELKHKAFEAKKKLAVDECRNGRIEKTFITYDDLISESIEKINLATRIEKPKSKWIVSNKVFFTFVFFFVLLISLAVTGIVKQVF